MADSHAALMDRTYRRQRHIYDLTRRFFLFGRDHAIRAMDPPPGGSVLEIACGTGRNLARIDALVPGCRLYGLDISQEMLRSARARLGSRAMLAAGDATQFDAQALFGRDGFDRILISYAVSMIPDWAGTLREGVRHLAPGGALHVVDFHDLGGYPAPFRRAHRAWLSRFHVTPRLDLGAAVARIGVETGCAVDHVTLYRGYAQAAVLKRPA
ncbi:O-methyltransferase [Roseivivax isoporae LMG 25204]|uniref:O-methyltransferase n=1 Tax=Roseivivax isoporae LMG 25204 TaxID=1449351 RepID=X7FBH0_9RHOB|nr:O-methyltransferase [Roseivivax isoporae LMG 25204]